MYMQQMYQFRRMPFGISTAPAVSIGSFGLDTCESYLDDVIAYNDKVAAHVP
ncbi:MAG: hypothetical protein GY696_08490 [Gammaproteobacteria bacterium]|nr:hypothetical protein [Gammaproteobacteria bacterium]